MITSYRWILFFIVFCPFLVHGQVPAPALIGYWHNWNDAKAPYIPLNQIDSRYNVIDVAFAVPQTNTDYKIQFVPDGMTHEIFIEQMQSVQKLGKKVIISIGGATAPISLSTTQERDTFIETMTEIIDAYGFDGIDIDLEGSSISVSGGSIDIPVDSSIIHLVSAIKLIMKTYQDKNGKRLILTMSPETAFVQGGMSAFSGIWGAYLPVIQALRDSIEILHVQLYNSGSMYGIDGKIYTQGSADFIVAMTEAVINGFSTAGGKFMGIDESKVAIGLPACNLAAGGGFTDSAIVQAAVRYLLGIGDKPGTYTLAKTAGYPKLRGLMTWSINWDAVSTCGGTYQYANTFEDLFETTSTGNRFSHLSATPNYRFYPNPSSDFIQFQTISSADISVVNIYGKDGSLLMSSDVSNGDNRIDVSQLPSGVYTIGIENTFQKFIKF
jgi:chitinase